ncbi:hypothetical protein [Chryseobacterium sp.]|uniref:hypothetical protein n=1 Tax=Chryseobacterium sp. TaxID=1871047 RepID=UPI002627947E|nr:hypothetical protein [Chryseobacterium sp.]
MKSIISYRPSPLLSVIYGLGFALSFSLLAALGYITFSYPLKKEYIAPYFLFILCLFFGYLFFRHLRKPVFHLSGNEINTGNEVILLSSIEDVFLFPAGKNFESGRNNLAFRTGTGRWYTISYDYSGNTDFFLENYLYYRAPFLLQQMEQGKTISFYYLTGKNDKLTAAIPNFTAKNLTANIISMTAKHIEINHHSYPYEDLKPLYRNREYFEIKTLEDEIILNFRYRDLLSFDVFMEVYNEKVIRS